MKLLKELEVKVLKQQLELSPDDKEIIERINRLEKNVHKG
jgi:hypothetical protein